MYYAIPVLIIYESLRVRWLPTGLVYSRAAAYIMPLLKEVVARLSTWLTQMTGHHPTKQCDK